MNAEIRGWNECLLTYVLAASAPRYPIDADVYHGGWAMGREFRNGREFYGVRLPLGPDYGGPLFFAHYSFLGLDPRGLRERYADYWQQNVAHTLMNYEHCVRNPNGFKGYGADCWGLSASDNHLGYSAHAPDNDQGVIAPTAALASFPYAPERRCARSGTSTMCWAIGSGVSMASSMPSVRRTTGTRPPISRSTRGRSS